MTDPEKAGLFVAVALGVLAIAAFLLRRRMLYVEVMLITAVALLLVVLGIYHLTHAGMPSGIMELAAFLVLVAATLAAIRRRHV